MINKHTMILDFLAKEILKPEVLDYKVYNGDIFTAVKTNNGDIGICANIDKDININSEKYTERVILQAHINSQVNQKDKTYDNSSFIDVISLKDEKDIIMVGFIEPIYNQMQGKGISCKVFDLRKGSPVLSPIKEFDSSLKAAKTIIITATTISNGSFDKIVEEMSDDAKMYMIGPSAPMTRLLFDYAPGLMGIFGSIVKSDAILKPVTDGFGTRQLSSYLIKGGLLR